MTRSEVIETMTEVFGHRLTSPPETANGWIIWRTDKSVQTLQKFEQRARDKGVRGVFVRRGTVGARDPE